MSRLSDWQQTHPPVRRPARQINPYRRSHLDTFAGLVIGLVIFAAILYLVHLAVDTTLADVIRQIHQMQASA